MHLMSHLLFVFVVVRVSRCVRLISYCASVDDKTAEGVSWELIARKRSV